MATYYSDIATKQNDPTAKNMVDHLAQIGQPRFATATWAIPSGAAAADIVNITRLPPRAQIVPHLCWVECDNPGTTLTLDFGDDDDSTAAVADRYSDGLTVSAGGGFAFTGADGVATLTPYTTAKACWLQMTLATASSLTTGADFTIRIAYLIA